MSKVKDLKRNKVLDMRVTFNGAESAMEVVRENRQRVCHCFDYRHKGKYVVLMHDRDEYCSWCERVEDYSSYV